MILTDLNEKKWERKVSIGDGTNLAILGEEIIHAKTMVDSEKREIVLKDLLFIPKLSWNLISVGRCGRNGIRISFDYGKGSRGFCTTENVQTS